MKTHLDCLNEILDLATGEVIANQCKVCNNHQHCVNSDTFCMSILRLAANSLGEQE